MYNIFYSVNNRIINLLFNLFKRGVFMQTKTLDYVALALVVIGAINWGLVGFFQFDLVATLFGAMSWISRIVYAVIGIAGIYSLTLFGRVSENSRT